MDKGVDIFSDHIWTLWGGLHLNRDTMIFSWVACGIVLSVAAIGRWIIFRQPNSMAAYLAKQYVSLFVDQLKPAYSAPDEGVISFYVTLATYLFICNSLILLPGCEEPTKDINCALALSIATFLFVQMHMIRAHGMVVWVQEYIKMPLAIRGVYRSWGIRSIMGISLRALGNLCVGIALFPMELLGKLSSVLSLSFRLFGNILAGSVISMLWLQFRSGSWIWQLFGIASGINLLITLFFGLFESLIQAGVFTMIAISYLVRAIHHET